MSVPFSNRRLDIRNYLCPLSVLKVRSILGKMKHNQVFEVWLNDSETKTILEQLINNSKDELIRAEKKKEYEKIYIKRHS